MTTLDWLPLAVVALVGILRNKKFVQIKAFGFNITFGDRPPPGPDKK